MPPDSPAPATGRPARLIPRDAATLVLIDRTGAQPRLLMGKRRAGLVFLPNKYVFPGGRVDASDRRVATADELAPAETSKLLIEMRGRPSATRARALALAAVRECFEEAGIVVGAPHRPGSHSSPMPSAPGPWAAFAGTGFAPSLANMTFFARAITPPGRPRRYDTRFFSLDARHIAHQTADIDGELERLDWFTLEEVRRLDLPAITRAIVEDLADRLQLAPSSESHAPVPFYFFRGGTFHRTGLSVG